MSIRSLAIPLLSGGVMLLGYAAFSWLRERSRVADGPTTLREAGLATPVRDRVDTLELDLDFEAELPPASPALRHDSRRQAVGALFLARATSALSPFDHERERFDGAFEEATPRSPSGIQSLAPRDDSREIPASERRPSVGGVRS